MHQPLWDPVLPQLVTISRAQVLIGLLPRQHVIHNDQDGMAQGHEREFLAPSGGKALVLSGEVGLLGFRRHMGRFDQHLARPSTAFPGLAAQALASTPMMAWAHPRPGREMLRTWEMPPVGAHSSQQALGGALTDSGTPISPSHRFLLGHSARLEHCTDTLDRVSAVVDVAEVLGQQKAVVGRELAL
jgi:hypothetical protein